MQHGAFVGEDQIDGAEGAGNAGEGDPRLDADHCKVAAVFLFQLHQRHDRRLDHVVEMRLGQDAIVKLDADQAADRDEHIKITAVRNHRAQEHQARHHDVRESAFLGVEARLIAGVR